MFLLAALQLVKKNRSQGCVIRRLVHPARSPTLSRFKAALDLQEVVPGRRVLQAQVPSCPRLEAMTALYPSWLPRVPHHSITAGWCGTDLSCGPFFWEQHLFLIRTLGELMTVPVHTCAASASQTSWQSGNLGALASCDPGASWTPQAFGGVVVGVCGQCILVMAAPGSWPTPVPFPKSGPPGAPDTALGALCPPWLWLTLASPHMPACRL